MTWAFSESACKSLASQVYETLGALAGELDASLNPHRFAMGQLGVNAMGWTKTPYNMEAFRLWSALMSRPPVESSTLHHLAIMHHARLSIGRPPTIRPRPMRTGKRQWVTGTVFPKSTRSGTKSRRLLAAIQNGMPSMRCGELAPLNLAGPLRHRF